MARSEPTESLVDRFLHEPGIEGETLEIKRKEKIESTEGRRDLVRTLVGMANKWGGTVIIGVKEEETEPIQSFEPESEAKRDLLHTVRANTIPDLSENLEINFDKISSGHRLLRIDISRTENQLCRFNDRGGKGHVPYYRVGDSTREMSPDDAIEFQEHRRQDAPYGYPERVETLPLPTASDPSRPQFSSPRNRFITGCEQRYQPVFGVELPSFRGPLTFELYTFLDVETVNDLKAFLEVAREHLSIDTMFRAGYSIQQGNRVHCGKGVDRLLDDVENIRNVVSNMLGGHPGEVNDTITHVDNYRATVILGTSCYYDFFQIQLYWKHGRFVDAQIQLLMRNIPFDDKHLHRFFDEMRYAPTRYQQRSGVQKFILMGDTDLQNPSPLQFGTDDDYTDFIEADNPFYGKEETVQHLVDQPLPTPLLERVCSIERIPFRIVDATTDVENTEFRLDKISIMPAVELWDPHFIQAECEAR